MLQVGQFDAPFTLENRTSDKYIDFMERSVTVRAFGIPSNKEVGGMVNGLLPNKIAYYSVGLFNGDGQNFANVDNKFDAIGRAYIAPFALAGETSLEDIEIGGSFWLGDRGPTGLQLASQTTQGNFSFLSPTFKSANPAPATTTTPVEVHQQGTLRSFAAELNVPVMHRFGVRSEYVHKSQHLEADNATTQNALAPLSAGELKGWSMYGEAWFWIVGDDTILPQAGLELQPRLKKFETKAPRHGVMLAARYEHLDENITFDNAVPSNSVAGTRIINSFEFGANYWYSKRYRATFNYVLNHFDGDSSGIAKVESNIGGHHTEHEFLFRMAIAL